MAFSTGESLERSNNTEFQQKRIVLDPGVRASVGMDKERRVSAGSFTGQHIAARTFSPLFETKHSSTQE